MKNDQNPASQNPASHNPGNSKGGASWGNKKPEVKKSAWGIFNTNNMFGDKRNSAPNAAGENQIISSKGELDFFDPVAERTKILHRILGLEKRGAFPFNRNPIMPTDYEVDKRQEYLKSIKKPLHDYQIKGVKYLAAGSRRLLADGMGVGKSVAFGTLVATPFGFRKAIDIQIGDEVIGQNGKPCRVTARYIWEDVDFYKVRFNDNTRVSCCGEHLWSVLHTRQKQRVGDASVKNFSTKTTRDLYEEIKNQEGDKDQRSKYLIPSVEPVDYTKKDLPIDPYILGYYLGNGWSSEFVAGVAVNENDLSIISKIENYFGKQVSFRKRYKEDLGRYEKCITIIPFAKQREPFLEKLENLGIFKKKAMSKFIPSIYKTASIIQRWQLLYGLMDADGTISSRDDSNSIEFSTSSYKLAHGLREIVHSLGGVARIRSTKKRQENHLPHWRVSVIFGHGIIPFSSARQRSKYTNVSKDHFYRKIVDITPIGKKNGICFTVDDPNHLYIIQHYIVTHNTAQALISLPRKDRAGVIVVCPSAVKHGWMKEAQAWRPDLTPVTPQKKSHFRFPDRGHIVVVGWDSLPTFSPNYRNPVPFVLVVDEAHYAKSEKTTRHEKIMHFVNLADVVIGLTGTPMPNKVDDLWNIIQVCGMQRLPNEKVPLLGQRSRFARTFFDWMKGEQRPVGCRPEMVTILHKISLRRTARDVCKELPPITMNRVDCPVDKKVAKKLDEILARVGGEDEFKRKVEYAINLHENNGNVDDHLMRLRAQIDIAKLPIIEEMVSDIEIQGEHIVVFSPFVEIINQLRQRSGWGAITGGMSSAEKAVVEDGFNSGTIKWIGITTAGATGINLPGPDTKPCVKMIRTSLDWSPATNAQVIKRIDRVAKKLALGINKGHCINIYDVYLNHKIDHIVWTAIHKKRMVLEAMGLHDDVDKSPTFNRDYYNLPPAIAGQEANIQCGFNNAGGRGGGRGRGR